MRRFVIAAILALSPALAAAQPVVSATALTPSVRDIIELSKAGLDEEVLLALIEVNRAVYPVDAETLKALKAGGVPQQVILAMVRSGRDVPPAAEPDPAPLPLPVAAPPPQVIIVEREPVEPRVREVAVPVPVYVAVPVRRAHDGRRPDPPKPVEPVYWGFGGKLRPDAWKPTAADVQKDAKVPREPQRK